MKKEQLKLFLNKNIHLHLTDGCFYSGQIDTYTDDSIIITDKFQQVVYLKLKDIIKVSEVRLK